MDCLKSTIDRVDSTTSELRTLIGQEKRALLDMIEEDRIDEKKYRLFSGIELHDLNSKIGHIIKETKASIAIVKLGEKQIDQITEKMESFKGDNVKYKHSMKSKFYDMDVSTLAFKIYLIIIAYI